MTPGDFASELLLSNLPSVFRDQNILLTYIWRLTLLQLNVIETVDVIEDSTLYDFNMFLLSPGIRIASHRLSVLVGSELTKCRKALSHICFAAMRAASVWSDFVRGVLPFLGLGFTFTELD